MEKKLLAVFFCIFIIFTTTLAWADIRSEIQSQHQRIKKGERSRDLTYAEARALEDNLIRIERYYRRASRDGWISHHEEGRLYQMLERNSRKIHRLKDNNIGRDY
jgi:hypothetical protein